MALGLLAWLAAAPLWALERPIKASAHNYTATPVTVARPQASLIEIFATPGQGATNRATFAQLTRVRYANRAGLEPSVFMVSGQVMCANTGGRAVEAFSLDVVLLDAFHQPIQTVGLLTEPLTIQQVLPPGESKRVTWERRVNTPDRVYEVAVVVTQVRFVDGTVWTAPEEELLDVF